MENKDTRGNELKNDCVCYYCLCYYTCGLRGIVKHAGFQLERSTCQAIPKLT